MGVLFLYRKRSKTMTKKFELIADIKKHGMIPCALVSSDGEWSQVYLSKAVPHPHYGATRLVTIKSDCVFDGTDDFTDHLSETQDLRAG